MMNGEGPMPVDLSVLETVLLAAASSVPARRAARTVHDGLQLRQTALALLAGAELAEHESPPEATLLVLAGRIRLHGQGRHWDIDAGMLLPIPPERHSVTAIDDSVFLLTVRRAASSAVTE